MTAAKRAKLWIGPSGWSYDDWLGIVYPRPKPRGFKPLAHLARFFNAVEVNSSFYRIPSPRMTAAWPRLVPAEFRFAVKLTQIFTHGRRDFPGPRDVDAFNAALVPLREAGMLGPLLMQFPWSFRYTSEAVEWLRRLADAFPDLDRFVEVRHASWEQPEALDALRSVGGYCNIDQPRLRNCLRPTQHVFGRNAYVSCTGATRRTGSPTTCRPTSATTTSTMRPSCANGSSGWTRLSSRPTTSTSSPITTTRARARRMHWSCAPCWKTPK